jgi:hypothetical protein
LGNVNEEILNYVADGLKRENPYCIELRYLWLSVQQGGLTAGINVIPSLVDQNPLMSMSCYELQADWCYIITCDNF